MKKTIEDTFTKRPGSATLALGILTTILFSIWWHFTRQPMECGPLADCVKYRQMTQSYLSGNYQPIDGPFHTRIATPWFASLTGHNIRQGFFIINSIAAVIFTAAWYGIVRYLNLRNIEYFSLLIWFLIHPLGLGHYQSIPESVDPTAHAMLALITLMFFTRSKLLLPTLFIALMAKESFIFISIIIIVSELCHAKATNGTDRYSSIYFITGIISVLITYKLAAHLSEMYWFAPTNGHAPSSLDTVRHFWREVRREPARLIVWLTAIICVVGAFPILLIKRKRIPNSPLNKRVSVYFLLGSSGFIALGLLGGSDMSRIIFTGNLLVLGFMMWPADGHLPTPWHTLLALILGSLIALSYTHLLPASLEYDYYMQGQRLRPTLTVLTVGCITLLVGWGLSRNGLVRKTDGILVNLPAETRQ